MTRPILYAALIVALHVLAVRVLLAMDDEMLWTMLKASITAVCVPCLPMLVAVFFVRLTGSQEVAR